MSHYYLTDCRSNDARRNNLDVHSLQFFYLVALCLMLGFLSGCAVFKDINPVAAATSLEQKAFASYGTFVIFQERAVDIVRDNSIPVNVRRRVQQAEAIAKPSADLVFRTAEQVIRARHVYEATQGEQERLVAVIGQLQDSLDVLGPKLSAFIAAVNDAGKRSGK